MKAHYLQGLSLALVLAFAMLWVMRNDRNSMPEMPLSTMVPAQDAWQMPPVQSGPPEEEIVEPSVVQETGMRLDGVNELFADEPRIQRAWISRGEDVVLINHPEADAANFRNAFFHRGFRHRPVTCGEVQLLSRGDAISAFQRFIYVGVQSSHLESDIPKFELLWDKLCVQTFGLEE